MTGGSAPAFRMVASSHDVDFNPSDPERTMPSEELPAAGDPIPSNCRIIEVRVAALPHLFNTIDPTPFKERDLDPRVEEFIVGWAREIPHNKRIALLVHLDQRAG